MPHCIIRDKEIEMNSNIEEKLGNFRVNTSIQKRSDKNGIE
jgi:hypothetical protein